MEVFLNSFLVVYSFITFSVARFLVHFDIFVMFSASQVEKDVRGALKGEAVR